MLKTIVICIIAGIVGLTIGSFTGIGATAFDTASEAISTASEVATDAFDNVKGIIFHEAETKEIGFKPIQTESIITEEILYEDVTQVWPD